jgi:hypothetical protein
MTERANPFATLNRPPILETRARKEKQVANETIESIAADHNFPSRQARKQPKLPKRERRLYRTGRNISFGIKASSKTIERFIGLADMHDVSQARLLELALDALERAEATSSTQTPVGA